MGWMTRLTTLVKADAHGVIDALEDRALLLRQHLREAQQAVEAKRAGVEALEAEDRELAADGERLAGRLASLETDVTLAMAEDRDDLARFAIKKLLPAREARDRLDRRRRAVDEERGRLVEELASDEAALVDLEARVKARLAGWQAEGKPWTEEALVVTEDEVELELLRRRSADEGGA